MYSLHSSWVNVIPLTERADQAKQRAEATLGVAERVVEALDEAAAAQSGAETAIMDASGDIEATQNHLTQVYTSSFTLNLYHQLRAHRTSAWAFMSLK